MSFSRRGRRRGGRCSDIGRRVLGEQGKYLLSVLPVGWTGTAHVTRGARQHEPRSFDEDWPEQRMHDPHVVAAVSELGIGQAFRAVLHLVGRDAETLQLVLERQGVTGSGASTDGLLEFVVAVVALAQRERSEIRPFEPRSESPPIIVGLARDRDPPVRTRHWERAMRGHRGVTVPAQSEWRARSPRHRAARWLGGASSTRPARGRDTGPRQFAPCDRARSTNAARAKRGDTVSV